MAEPKVSMCREADVTIKSFHFEPIQSTKDGSITYHTVDNDDEVVSQEFCETDEAAVVTEKLKNLVLGFCNGKDVSGKSLVNDPIFHTTCAVSNEYPKPNSSGSWATAQTFSR